jgi:uncharacterized protein
VSVDLTSLELDQFVDRYVAMWHEADPIERRRTVERLWAADAMNCTPTLLARGHDEITARVASAHERFVATGEYRFRPRGEATGHHDSVCLEWEMVGVADGVVAGGGLDFFLLAPDGRIQGLYQYGAPAR